VKKIIYKKGFAMNSHALKKTVLATSFFLSLIGLYGSTALPAPECEPGSSEQTDTSESKNNQGPTEALVEAPTVQVIDLPDKINRLYDKLKNANEVKYYSFTALRGQKVMINDVLRGTEGTYWNVEYNIAGHWQPAPKYDSVITPLLTPGQKVQLRVSHLVGEPFHPDKYFHIDFGSAPYAHYVRIETVAPPTGSQFWTKTFRDQIMWATNIRDSTGHLLEGATVNFVITADDQHPSNANMAESQRVTVTGGIVEYVNFPACHGRQVTPIFTGVYDFINKWQVTYNTGHWHVSVRGNPAANSSPVPITQICTMKLIQ
jgi:hypothetical protein